jgi:hypothetical protein
VQFAADFGEQARSEALGSLACLGASVKGGNLIKESSKQLV